ncbi:MULTISPECIES: hypothetical protein [Streptomyces]|uniref:Uncharacterized protein n=1 Tax=Streptomyces evansiae TaxID=3075535 RepID=A0ABU2QZP2_9ACTN|nr:MULTISPECIES: hypothetical protein [unclassified Streptomyces]MDT0409911.1 hypothetical protein [Streptomyces sp. DSM 41979]MYQ60001.1 hypothetical protein [Streptomyces sp. SID4926]SCE40260.1 hypothetical protein GA0115252_146421 [Streptomyces sp. DfronAA-171]
MSEQPTAFFQPGTTYLRGRWSFQCLAAVPNPFNGEIRAVGFLYRTDEPASPIALDPDDWATGRWEPQPNRIPAETAAHVLWHEHRDANGYPAGSFTAALLALWDQADDTNSRRLAIGWPDYAAARALAATTDGLHHLRDIATTN